MVDDTLVQETISVVGETAALEVAVALEVVEDVRDAAFRADVDGELEIAAHAEGIDISSRCIVDDAEGVHGGHGTGADRTSRYEVVVESGSREKPVVDHPKISGL